VYFAEVQMQRDNDLNERIFSEVGIFIRQNKGNFRDWQVAIIYPTRKIEQISTEVPAELFASGRFLRIYLDELGPIDELPIGYIAVARKGDRGLELAKDVLQNRLITIIAPLSFLFVNRFPQEICLLKNP
jgi:hypothetical protein